uniref:Conotoxin Ca5.1 n=1 Tax=Conus caracteristicus TaxID=89440 RepID=CT51_CONCB|nr:RecName: Full=Conotoxin Ca5.1; AltName: Full=Ca-92; Flags: Precursor [Conus caracteristicus]ABW77580.1 tau conotoxin 5.1 [Conus caracteristicus]
MRCVPVFIILLLLASPAASDPLEKRIQSDLIRAALEDADTKNDPRILEDIVSTALATCCKFQFLNFCCNEK